MTRVAKRWYPSPRFWGFLLLAWRRSKFYDGRRNWRVKGSLIVPFPGRAARATKIGPWKESNKYYIKEDKRKTDGRRLFLVVSSSTRVIISRNCTGNCQYNIKPSPRWLAGLLVWYGRFCLLPVFASFSWMPFWTAKNNRTLLIHSGKVELEAIRPDTTESYYYIL